MAIAEKSNNPESSSALVEPVTQTAGMSKLHKAIFAVLLIALIILPFLVYPIFAMK